MANKSAWQQRGQVCLASLVTLERGVRPTSVITCLLPQGLESARPVCKCLGNSFQDELGACPGKSLSRPGTQFPFPDNGTAVKSTVKAWIGIPYCFFVVGP